MLPSVSSFTYVVKQNKDTLLTFFFSLNSRKNTPWLKTSDKQLHEQLSQGEIEHNAGTQRLH